MEILEVADFVFEEGRGIKW